MVPPGPPVSLALSALHTWVHLFFCDLFWLNRSRHFQLSLFFIMFSQGSVEHLGDYHSRSLKGLSTIRSFHDVKKPFLLSRFHFHLFAASKLQSFWLLVLNENKCSFTSEKFITSASEHGKCTVIAKFCLNFDA